jgi:hypothetical protein
VTPNWPRKVSRQIRRKNSKVTQLWKAGSFWYPSAGILSPETNRLSPFERRPSLPLKNCHVDLGRILFFANVCSMPLAIAELFKQRSRS